MASMRNGRASAAFRMGRESGWVDSVVVSAFPFFCSRQVAQGHSLRSFCAVQWVTFPSLHVIEIAWSPSRSMDVGKTSVAVDFDVDLLDSEYSFMISFRSMVSESLVN